MKKVLGLFMVIFLLSACSAIQVNLEPNMINSGTKPDIKVKGAINIINATTSKGYMQIGSTGKGMGQIPKKVQGDLYQWTETAVEMLNDELEKSNIVISADATKSLSLSVTEAKIQAVGFLGGNRCDITLKVITKDKKENIFTAHHIDPNRGIEISVTAETALSKALTLILNDQYIIDYLQN